MENTLSSTANYKVTLKSIANSIYPGWTLQNWFDWPPNMFALISMVLQRTGSYRICLLETRWWEHKEWQNHVGSDAIKWIEYSNDLILNKKRKKKFEIKDSKILTKEIFELIEKGWSDIDLNDLRVISDIYYTKQGVNNKSENAINFTISLIKVFCVADSCCSGLGLVGEMVKQPDYHLKLFKAVANLLLNNTGSLSTISKVHGIVLPKMRTPQSGLSLRSLSFHATFHITEVEVMWRTFPWLNNHKQSLNILAIPYPNKVTENDFRILKDEYHVVKYFDTKNDKKNIDIALIDSIIKLVQNEINNNKEIDIIIFPETSLLRDEYSKLLAQLELVYKHRDKNKSYKLPIVIAGVKSFEEFKKNPRSKIEKELYHNELRMATFFAGQWYEITQRKHHRWSLNRDQIRQYQLEGHLSTERIWFENSSIFQRRLSVLAPNSWLAMTSLICEDLARQEPVGDVLRGIGPTLLIALLSDGPQLTNRWSARYASVLADDPGSSVLSLTSAGMVGRSQKIDLGNNENNINQNTNHNKQTIGLWKDLITGWKELQIGYDEKAKGLLFTISAIFREEFTLDGRSDFTNASVFRLDTLNPVEIALDTSNQEIDNNSSTLLKVGNWNDIRELSAAFFSTDSIIDLLQLYKPESTSSSSLKKTSEICISDSIETILNLLQHNDNVNEIHPFWKEIKSKVSLSWENHNDIGIEAMHFDKNDHMSLFVTEVRKLKNDIINSINTSTKKSNFFELLIKYCKDQLDNLKEPIEGERGIPQLTIVAFLYSIHTKLSYCSYIKYMNAKKGISIEKAQTLIQSIEEILKKIE